jgi:hypothetical protein
MNEPSQVTEIRKELHIEMQKVKISLYRPEQSLGDSEG